MSTPIRFVYFDFGGVLGVPQDPDALSRQAELVGVPAVPYRQEYFAHRLSFDDGTLDAFTYWATIAASFGVSVDEKTVADLSDLDYRSYCTPNRSVYEWVAALRRDGIGTGIISNMPVDYAERLAGEHLTDGFDPCVISARLGVNKPGPAIYRFAVDSVRERGIGPDECLFLDDMAANVEGAIRSGLRAHRFAIDDADTIAQSFALPPFPLRVD